MDGILDFLPSPLDINTIEAKTDKNETVICDMKDSSPFVGMVFKVANDPYVDLLSFCRVYSGVLKVGDVVFNASNKKRERITRMVRMHANNKEDIQEVYSGDIAAIIGLKTVVTGDTLTSMDRFLILNNIDFPEPVISLAIEAKSKNDENRLPLALRKLNQEDPSFKFAQNTETGQLILSGMGELHLEVLVDRLKREFNVHINVGMPQVAYRECLIISCVVVGEFLREGVEQNQYAKVSLQFDIKQEEGLEFYNEIKESISMEFVEAIKSTIVERMNIGILAGYPVYGLIVYLKNIEYREKEPTELALRAATSIAMNELVDCQALSLLEPIMKVEVVVSDIYIGDVVSDLNRRRGVIITMESGIVEAEVPLSKMFGYSTDLRSLSQGRATYTMEFLKYIKASEQIVNEVISKTAYR